MSTTKFAVSLDSTQDVSKTEIQKSPLTLSDEPMDENRAMEIVRRSMERRRAVYEALAK